MRRQTALPPLLFKKNLIFVKKSLPFYRKQAKGSNSTKLLLKNYLTLCVTSYLLKKKLHDKS